MSTYYSEETHKLPLNNYSKAMLLQYLSSNSTTTGSEDKYSEAILHETTAIVCNRELLVDWEADGGIADIDNSFMDQQLCTTFACDIYNHLRASEVKKRPSTDYMDKIQKDINPSMRALLVDWLVEVAEGYSFVPETLYLAVNYIDRYLSGIPINRERLKLLGVACLMLASKYEFMCTPSVEKFCDLTNNIYLVEEVLEMECSVLSYLKYEMTTVTTKCFLSRFVRAAQGANELPSLHLECLANYLAELSLLDYSMLCYASSLIAASAIFLANYIMLPSKRPWNATLQHYTLYQPLDLRNCVKDLHRLCCNNSLPAIREKYSQHEYKCVAEKQCPATIPEEYVPSIASALYSYSNRVNLACKLIQYFPVTVKFMLIFFLWIIFDVMYVTPQYLHFVMLPFLLDDE